MAKNMLPTKGGGIVSKVIWLVVGLAILMLVVRYPGDVASWIKEAVHMLTSTVSGLVAFFRQLGR